MKKNFIILILIIFPLSVFAENLIVKGKVTCENKPLYGVAITDGENIVFTNKKGEYKITSNNCRFVYYTLPAGYLSPTVDGIPCFYKEINPKAKKQIINFELIKEKKSQEKYSMLVWADPQVSEESELEMLDTVVSDMKTTIATYEKTQPVYAICCGDIVFDKLDLFEPYKKTITSLDIPFYQSIGNHDMNYNNRSNELSTVSYGNSFGPAYYSYNLGKIHYVVLDDVFYYGYTYRYLGYIDEKQLSWLEKDLENVPKGSTVIVTLHIPTVYGESEKPNYLSQLFASVMNKQALFDILEPYIVHILAGHTHMQWTTIVNENLTEHVFAAACGAWWQGPVCTDGCPRAYDVFEIDGENITWYYKGVGLDRTNQFKLYPVGADKSFPEDFVANVYNYDANWQVQWYENDTLRGEMQRYWGKDPLAAEMYQPGKNKRYNWLQVSETHHLFKAKPANENSEIKVKVTDRFGNVYQQTIKK